MHKYLKDVRIQLIWPKAGLQDRSWTQQKVKAWVEHTGASISISNKIELDITHLVCDADTWQAKKAAYESHWAESSPDKKPLVVSTGWLQSCLQDQKKYKVHNFLLTKQSDANMSKKDELRTGPKDGINSVLDVFTQSTASHVHPLDQAELDDQVAAQRAQDDEARAAKERKEKARKDEHNRKLKEKTTLGSTHHVYRGSDGFVYDIMLTKADIFKNYSERTWLTIYESNNEPHNYATSVHLDKNEPRHTGATVMACEAVSFPVARRQFLELFSELTYIDWSQRRDITSFKTDSADISFEDKPWTYRAPHVEPFGDL